MKISELQEYLKDRLSCLKADSVTLLQLNAACRERHGGKHAGLDYFQRQYRKDIKAGKVKPFRLDNGKEEAV